MSSSDDRRWNMPGQKQPIHCGLEDNQIILSRNYDNRFYRNLVPTYKKKKLTIDPK